MKLVPWLFVVKATLFNPHSHKPPVPFNRDIDGYYFMRKTLAVFDGRIDDKTTIMESTVASTIPTSTNTGTGTGTENSQTNGSLDTLISTTQQEFKHRPFGRSDVTDNEDVQFNLTQEAKIASLRKAAFPLQGRLNSSMINDELIKIHDNPINPMYRDKTKASTYVDSQYKLNDDGWQIIVNLKSRSKRCKTFTCLTSQANSLSEIVKCIDESAPGCVLDAKVRMDLLNPVRMCCYDSIYDGEHGSESANAYLYSNYTWILPTPRMILDLTEQNNVSSFARFSRPYKTGLAATTMLSGGFGLTKMIGGCADFRSFEIEQRAAHVSNPAACDHSQVEYIDCHGWPSVNAASEWDKKNLKQLIFNAVLNRSNCVTAAAQYQLLTARIVAETILFPSAGHAAKQAEMLEEDMSKEVVALDYGYNEYPASDVAY